jgi:hypothetical protein
MATNQHQNYANHIRYYPPHHYIFLPFMGLLIITGIIKAYLDSTHLVEWLLFSTLSFSILYLAIMLRQHYALGNQDRIVRLEFRLRYYETFGEKAKITEEKLAFSQIAALRFAPDSEFKDLLERTLKENLTADMIKRSIKNWQADLMRL